MTIAELYAWAIENHVENCNVVVEGISSVKKDTPDNLLVDLRDVLENYSDLYWNEGLLAFKDELDAVYENIRNLAKI